MKQVYFKVIKTLVILVGMFVCFNFLNQTVFAKTIYTSASSKNIFKYYVDKDYKYVIKPKKTGIMKMNITLKTVKGFEDTYGSVELYVLGYYKGSYIYGTYLSNVNSAAKKKKTIKFLVEKGKKYYIELSGEDYSFDITWNIKKLTRPMFKESTNIGDWAKLKLKWTSFRKAKSYELQVSTDKRFKKKTRRWITKRTCKNVRLQVSDTYYVRVRARSFGRRNNVSKWSKKITVRC